MSLTSQLADVHSPIAQHLRERFPNVPDVQRRYRLDVGDAQPITPAGPVAYGTIGTALDWRLRFLLDAAPDTHLALAGAEHVGRRALGLAVDLIAALGASVRVQMQPGPTVASPPPGQAPTPMPLDEERLVRGCYALALYSEVFRAGLLPGSPLLGLPQRATVSDLFALASDAEVADLLALTELARAALLPALAALGPPVVLGPVFAGSGDVGGADADVIAGGALVEVKTTLGGQARDGRRRCSLAQQTVHQLLGYLLLDYDDAYAISALGVYAARYGHLACWPLAELLPELAGGPVDLAAERAAFQGVAGTVAAARAARPTRSASATL
jgi:hypothetical protein